MRWCNCRAPIGRRKPGSKRRRCADNGNDGDFTLVQCQGKIVTNYNGEVREIGVSHRQFKAAQSGDAWLMCGYK
jgi:hypothetical protein